MQECVGAELTAMAAFMPIDLATASQLTEQAQHITGKVCEVSNINSPSQVLNALQLRLDKIMFEGPASDLKLTEFTQPALLTHSMAIMEILKV